MTAPRIRYQTLELGTLDIHLRTLRDRQQFADEEGHAEALGIGSASWPLFGVVWDSGRALALEMLGYPIDGRRVLEVGCGLGLASIILSLRRVQVTATDHHPEAGEFLRRNVELNGGMWNNVAAEGAFDWYKASMFDMQRYNYGSGTLSGGRLENICCVQTPTNDCSVSHYAAGTNEDWMQFFWSLVTDPICAASLREVLDLYAETRLGGGLSAANYWTQMQAAASSTGMSTCEVNAVSFHGNERGINH